MPKSWDRMTSNEKIEFLKNQNETHFTSAKRLAAALDELALQAMACIAVVGAMSETSLPSRERVDLWCRALRRNSPGIDERALESKAGALLDGLRTAVPAPPDYER
jgi:hypothetical protein